MARPRKSVETKKIETVPVETVVVNPLELRVTKNVVGVLETNIGQLEKYVDTKLEEYKPELYAGDADSAKKDRAELNNSKKFLSQTRINLMRELMKPYEDFETRCKALEKKIDTASSQLDAIVKTKEEQEKAKRKMRCCELWLSRNFTLFPIDKIFNSKWLNKTTKESEILAEMDSIISKVYADLKTIESQNDAETLKAHYLITLDLSETLAYGQELARQREVAEREAREREEREHAEAVKEQTEETREEAYVLRKKERMQSLIDEASESVPTAPKKKDWVISFSADERKILEVKNALNQLGVVYTVNELEF